MPDVRNCRKCGKIYNYIGGSPICPVCRQLEEEEFKRVKDYLYDNPGASITQVSTELDISIELIKRFLKEGRLEIVGECANMVLECEICGKSINSGRYCPECERELSNGLKSTASQLSQQLGAQGGSNSSGQSQGGRGIGMRYLNKDDKK